MAGVRDRVAVVTGAAQRARAGDRAAARPRRAHGSVLVIVDARRARAHGSDTSRAPGGPRSPAWSVISQKRSRRRGSIQSAPVERYGAPLFWSTWSGAAARGKSGKWRSRTGTLSCVSTSAQYLSLHAIRTAAHDAAALRGASSVCPRGPGGHPVDRLLPGRLAYSAAKAGVHGFVRDVALELAEHGSTSTRLRQGPIDTERFGPGCNAERDGGVQPESHDAAAPLGSPSRSRTPCSSSPPTRPATSPATRWPSPGRASRRLRQAHCFGLAPRPHAQRTGSTPRVRLTVSPRIWTFLSSRRVLQQPAGRLAAT